MCRFFEESAECPTKDDDIGFHHGMWRARWEREEEI